MNTSPASKNNAIYWWLLALILILYTLLQLLLIPTLPLTYSESFNVQVSRLMTRGYTPYIQIFTLEKPLFVWFLGWLGNLSATGFKVIFLGFQLLLMLNLATLTRRIFGSTVALAAVVLLAATSTFIVDAAQGTAITPALTLATLSLLLILRYVSTKKFYWAAISGGVWAVALCISFSISGVVIVALLFFICFRTDAQRNVIIATTWRDIPGSAILLWLISATIVIALAIFVATPTVVFSHIINTTLTLQLNLPSSPPQNFILFGQFATLNFVPCGLIIYSLTRIYDQPDHPVWIILIWTILSLIGLMVQPAPDFVDTVTLLPPMAIIAGWGTIDLARRFEPQRRWVRLGGAIILVALILSIGWQQVNSFILRDVETEDDLLQRAQLPQIVKFIQQHTALDDCVIIDDSALSIYANRLPAPQLVGLSPWRMAGGLLTEEKLEALVQAQNCTAVVFSKRKYTLPLADFKEWAENYYPNEHSQFTRLTIYYE